MPPMAPKKAPLVICGVNINAIYEPEELHRLLQTCEDFNDKNKIFARLMDIMPGGPADGRLLPLVLEQLGGSLRRQRRSARRASEGAISDSGTESGEDAGEIGCLLRGLRGGLEGVPDPAGRRRPSPQLVSEAVGVLDRLRESFGEESGEEAAELLQLVERLQSSLRQRAPPAPSPVPPPRRGQSRRLRRAQTVGITREELAEIRRRLTAARKQAPSDTSSHRTTGPAAMAAAATGKPGGTGGRAPAAASRPAVTLYSTGARPFSRRLSQEYQQRRLAAPQRVRRGPPPPPWVGTRPDPASSSVMRAVAAVNAIQSSEPPRRAGRLPRPHTIGASDDDYAAIRAAIDSEISREATPARQESSGGDRTASNEPCQQQPPEQQQSASQRPQAPQRPPADQPVTGGSPGRQTEDDTVLIPQRATVHEARRQFARSTGSRVQHRDDTCRPTVPVPVRPEVATSRGPSAASSSTDPRPALSSALRKQMNKEQLPGPSRVSREDGVGGGPPGQQAAGPEVGCSTSVGPVNSSPQSVSQSGDPAPQSVSQSGDPAPQSPAQTGKPTPQSSSQSGDPAPQLPSQTAEPVSEPAVLGEPSVPAQYTCSIITQETQTAELPPPSPAADSQQAPGVGSAPGGGTPSWGRQDATVAPPVTSPSPPTTNQPPWARQGRGTEPEFVVDASPTPTSRPIWARHGQPAGPASGEVSPVAGGSHLPWVARQDRPAAARSSSVTRLASAFSAADAQPPAPAPPAAAVWDRRARLEKARSLYCQNDGPEADGPSARPRHETLQQQRKMSVPDGAEQRHALERSKSAEHLFGRDRNPLKQTPFHEFERMEWERKAQIAALQPQLHSPQQQQQQRRQQPFHRAPAPSAMQQQQSQQPLQHQYQNVHHAVPGQQMQQYTHQQQGGLVRGQNLRHQEAVSHQEPETQPNQQIMPASGFGPHHTQQPTNNQSAAMRHPAGARPDLSHQDHQHTLHHQQHSPLHYPDPCSPQIPQQVTQHQQNPDFGHHQETSQFQCPCRNQGHQNLQDIQCQQAPQSSQDIQHHQVSHHPQIHQPYQSPQYHQISRYHQSPQYQQSPQYPPGCQYNHDSYNDQAHRRPQGVQAPQNAPQPVSQPYYQDSQIPHVSHHHQVPQSETSRLHQQVPSYYQAPPSQQVQHHQGHVHPGHLDLHQTTVPHNSQQTRSPYQTPLPPPPSGPRSPTQSARSGSVPPRPGLVSPSQSSPAHGTGNLVSPGDSCRTSRVFVPVSAAAEAEAEARPPWAGSHGSGRVKQRAASLSGAEPPPLPDTSRRPPSADFGRHTSAFAATGQSRASPRAAARPASWDPQPDLRTASLARAAAAPLSPQKDGHADPRAAFGARAAPPPAPARLPPPTPRAGGLRLPAAGNVLQRSSSTDMLRGGVATRPFEAHLDATSAQQKKQQLDSFFREREDERLARSFDDLLDDDDRALVAPAGKSAGAPHALSKSHTVGDMRSAQRRSPAAGGTFARRQRAWESSTGASMAVGLGSYGPPSQKPPSAAEKASTSTTRSPGKSRGKKIDEDTLDLVRKYFAKEGM